MTTTARMIENADGSPRLIEVRHVEGGVDFTFRTRWEELRSFSGSLLELIGDAEANSDPPA